MARSARFRPTHLLATILHTVFDVGQARITPYALPAEITQLVVDGTPIADLF